MIKDKKAVENTTDLTTGAKTNGVKEDGMINDIVKTKAGTSPELPLRMTSHKMTNNGMIHGMIPETVDDPDLVGKAGMRAGIKDGILDGMTTVEAALSNKKKRKISSEIQQHGPHMEYRNRPHLGRTGALVEARHLNRQKAKTRINRDRGYRCHHHHIVTGAHNMSAPKRAVFPGHYVKDFPKNLAMPPRTWNNLFSNVSMRRLNRHMKWLLTEIPLESGRTSRRHDGPSELQLYRRCG